MRISSFPVLCTFILGAIMAQLPDLCCFNWKQFSTYCQIQQKKITVALTTGLDLTNLLFSGLTEFRNFARPCVS